MDNQFQQPNIGQPQQPVQQASVQPPAPPVAKPTAPTAQATKPTLEVSDQAAQALLAFNNIQSAQPTKLKTHISMLIALGLIVALIIIASFALGSLKPKNNTNNTNTTNSSSSNPTNNAATNGDQQINQDVNSCKNVVNAVSEC